MAWPAVLVWLAASCKPAADPADRRAIIERGRYVSNLAGCPFCHADGPELTFAGGIAARERSGIWRGANITPHDGTGIGRWTDDQVIAAIREGVRPDGRGLHPIMPVRNYHRMTDADAKAVVAFLRSLAPIDHAVAPSDPFERPRAPVGTPANERDPVEDPARHGEYLVTLMHCTTCHATPDQDGLPDPARPFAGGRAMEPFGTGLAVLGTGKLYASNLTSDPETGIGTWTVDQIARSIRTLTRPDGTPIRGPMLFYLPGWSVIVDDDLQAIAIYLQQLPPMKHRVPAATFTPR